MNVEDVVQWADNLIFDRTGANLTALQEAILTGVWQRQKYPQIAKDFHCSESHVKKEAAKLWEKLGKELGEDLNKFNFRSKLEKKYKVAQSSKSGDCLLSVEKIGKIQKKLNSPFPQILPKIKPIPE